MAGSCTSTITHITERNGTFATILTFDLTSDASGNVSSVGALSGVTGRVEMMSFEPSTGDTAPTDGCTVTLLDANGRDVLLGRGATLSNDATNTAANIRNPLTADLGYLFLWRSTLTPACSGMGNAKKGRLVVVLR